MDYSVDNAAMIGFLAGKKLIERADNDRPTSAD